MSAFKRLEPEDLLDNVIVVEPQYNFVSGTAGWRGSPEGGANAINMYGGHARTGIVSEWRYDQLRSNPNSFGQQRLTQITASVDLVWMTNEALPLGQVTNTRWGEEHWDTIQRLYEYYSKINTDYNTSSYDFYSVYLNQNSQNIITGNGINYRPSKMTGSFTLESWIKPFLTSSVNSDFTVMSTNQLFWFGVTGSTGRLVFSSSAGAITASSGPTPNRWNHVSFAYDAVSQTGTFRINLVDAGSRGIPNLVATSYTGAFCIGATFDSGTISAGLEFHSSPVRGRYPLHGLIGETRVWKECRSYAALSSSWNITLTGSAQLTASIASIRFVEGPLANFGGSSFSLQPTKGSGTVDYSIVGRYDDPTLVGAISSYWMYLWQFNDIAKPVWIPNDNTAFYPPKRLVAAPYSGSVNYVAPNLIYNNQFLSSVDRMLVVNVPRAFYGRQIQPGSIKIEDRAFSSGSHSLVRVVVDDGRGGLYISGSVCSSSIANKEDYAGVGWNKVGNVFYGEGLIVIKDPSMLDLGRDDQMSSHPNDTFQLSFRGHSRIPVKTIMCRLDKGEFNCTTNRTFSTVDSDGQKVRRFTSGSIWITAIGLYDSERQLVGVAKLAQPLRKRTQDRITIKIREDF